MGSGLRGKTGSDPVDLCIGTAMSLVRTGWRKMLRMCESLSGVMIGFGGVMLGVGCSWRSILKISLVFANVNPLAHDQRARIDKAVSESSS